MTTTQPTQSTSSPPPAPQGAEQRLTASFSSLSHLSTLWVPLEETIGQWADFAHEAITVCALLAVGTAFGGLAWETRALRHYTWAVTERKRGRRRQEADFLARAVQDLDCALDQWQQAFGWLELAAKDKEQQELSSLDAIRQLLEQATPHQERRRTLHRQVLGEYARMKQQVRQSHHKEERQS